MLLFVIWKNPLKGQKLQGNVGKSRFCQCVGWQHFVPLGFLLQTFLSRRLQTHFLQSRLAGCLSAGFFSFSSNPIWKLFETKSSFAQTFFLLPRSRIRRQSTPWKLHNSKLSNVYTPPPQPQPTSPKPNHQTFHQPPRFITHPRFGSAISTKPKPKVSATRRKLSSRGGKEVYCVIHQVVLGGCCCRFFFSERKKGRKTTWQNKGGLKKKVEWRHPFKKRGWGFKERQILIETCLKKEQCFCYRMSSSRKYYEGHTKQKVGNRSTQPRLYELHPNSSSYMRKKWSNSFNLQISQNETKNNISWSFTPTPLKTYRKSPWRTMPGILCTVLSLSF